MGTPFEPQPDEKTGMATFLDGQREALLRKLDGLTTEQAITRPTASDFCLLVLVKHVAFGVGVHRCIGASLSRMEIKVAAREIARRLDDIRLAVTPEEIAYLPTVATHQIERLPLTLARRR